MTRPTLRRQVPSVPKKQQSQKSIEIRCIQQAFCRPLPECQHDGILPAEKSFDIEVEPCRPHSIFSAAFHLVGYPTGSDHCLGGCTADIDTGTAYPLPFDQCCLQPAAASFLASGSAACPEPMRIASYFVMRVLKIGNFYTMKGRA